MKKSEVRCIDCTCLVRTKFQLNESNHVSSVHIHTIYFFVTMV
ncbi:unnamed protein product [Tenebrio molitor]|nr:unnamed protein product [Tenebrio molitor]